MTSIFVFLWLADVSTSWAEASSLLVAIQAALGRLMAPDSR